MKKYVYNFVEGSKEQKQLLGGKGANLAEMTRLGLPVPPGFTVTTEACFLYYDEGERLPDYLIEDIKEHLKELERKTGKSFGSGNNPLLLSVRSGAAISMPGMMDTVLNLGLNDTTVQGLARNTANERFAYDCYRRFIQMFGDVVLGVSPYYFSREIDDLKEKRGVETDPELTVEDLKLLVEKFKEIIIKQTGEAFPQEPKEQLIKAVEAVFGSWNNRRAIVYREANNIPHDLGTAVNVQTMVFGNMGEDSGTGVCFTRNPSTGEAGLYGEFLPNAQGEDVVAGTRTPMAIEVLKDRHPEIYRQINEIAKKLEKHYLDMQDIEFTIERGSLFLLQTRTGKRTVQAAIRIAVEMVEEGIIDKKTALTRVEPDQLEQILHSRIDTEAELNVIARGLSASPGAASGVVSFSPDEAEKLAGEGQKVILVSLETTPEDIHGVLAAQGVLTTRGGMTSHAAVVARGMGKPAVCGCESIKIDFEEQRFYAGDVVVKAGEQITINGSSGDVILGHVKMVQPELDEYAQKLLSWADEVRRLGIRTNADNRKDAERARSFGAEGIGLCRTEHMFMAPERVPIVQDLILCEDEEEKEAALARLLPLQRQDFLEIFEAMESLPVTIRLLDPPLHEFLPRKEELRREIELLEKEGQNQEELARKKKMLRQVKNMEEMNPMLGFRGCRLGILLPEIYLMQMRAIFEAACELKAKGRDVRVEVMVPLIADVNELAVLREKLEKVAAEIIAEAGVELDYLLGTMIELPRACLTADKIARKAEFFSFGTNDLTQTTYGFSRDDAEGKFLHQYLEKEILPANPFMVLDTEGVGQLIDMAVTKGRKVNPSLKVGICGEHGGNPASINFCHRVGLDYVSCSPFRVPVARLAAAQAAIAAEE